MKDKELRTEHIFQIMNTLYIWLLALSPLMSPPGKLWQGGVAHIQGSMNYIHLIFFLSEWLLSVDQLSPSHGLSCLFSVAPLTSCEPWLCTFLICFL